MRTGLIFSLTGADARRIVAEDMAVAEFPAPQPASGGSSVPVTAGVLAYALFAIAAVVAIASHGVPLMGPLVGVLGIVGIVVCYVKRDDASGTWVASHLTWLIRTFWWSLLWAVVGIVLFVTLIGIPFALALWLATDIWVIYRLVRGYLLYKDSKAIPGV